MKSLFAVALQFPFELRGPNLLQHDDAPVHKASSMKTWCVKVGVEELQCPAQSPDLNPTEHLWDELELETPYPTSAPDLTNALLNVMRLSSSSSSSPAHVIDDVAPLLLMRDENMAVSVSQADVHMHQKEDGDEEEQRASRSDSGSGEDSLDGLLRRACPLTPSLSPRKRTTSQSKTEPPLLRTNKRTIYTAGRPPWYNVTGTTFKEAFVIGLCGGSASGKTTVANKIIEALDVPWVVLLSMDSFYKVLSKEEQELAARNEYNFDHPDAFDFELLITVLRKLKKGKSIKVPVYDFTTHSRRKEWKTVYGANVVIFEGILAFANKELLKLLDMKVFVDTDSDIRLVRRLKRDISARGRDITGVIKQYNKFVKPAFEQYIEPTVQVADIVVPRGKVHILKFTSVDYLVFCRT
ncbi:hypothetical protein PDJAM_G00194860 [Pangasius djambal]|uniref:Uncharacterized protein n=1 Tax=Pangasius djambal TaxID=1691987 RepID=A0ACC5ZQC0_9TELE|nr:hypothetical protein [Pangasius djambal]